MKYLGDFLAGSTIRFMFSTAAAAGSRVDFSDALEAADIRVYKDGGATERSSTAGFTVTSGFDSLVGIHCVILDLADDTDAGFYAAGHDYTVVLYPSAETVDSLAVAAVIAEFSIENRNTKADVRSWLGTAVPAPAVAGVPTVQLSDAAIIALLSSPDAGVVRRNTAQGGGPGTITLDAGASATDGAYDDMVLFAVSGTGARQKMGTIQGYVGATKVAPLSPAPAVDYAADTVFVIVNATPAATEASIADEVQAVLEAGLMATISANVSAALDRLGAWASSTILGAFQALFRKDVSAPADIGGTFNPATESLEAIKDNHLPSGLVASQTEVLAIQNNTRVRVVIPAAMERPDSGNVPYRLLLYIYDDAGNMEAPDATPTIIASNQAGVSRSANLSAVTNPGTGAYYVDYTVASSHAIEGLLFEWSMVEGGITKIHGGASLVVDTTAVDFTAADRSDLQTVLARVGSPAGATLAVDIAAVKVDTGAIKTKTDALPSDPADASDVAAAVAGLASTLSTIAGYLDTEVAAIKAKTDNLPTDPADASDLAASFSSIASTLAIIGGYLDTEVGAIKAKTDLIPAGGIAAPGDAMALTVLERDALADAMLIRVPAGADAGVHLVRMLQFLCNYKERNADGTAIDVYTGLVKAGSTIAFSVPIVTDVTAPPITKMGAAA